MAAPNWRCAIFDAGAIQAHLDIELGQFDKKLTAAEERVKKFQSEKHTVRLAAVFDNASLGRARSAFAQLDQQLSRDAMQRLRGSPQGSVLGSLNALFSPHPVTGAPSPAQAASQGLLGRVARQVMPGGTPGSGGAVQQQAAQQSLLSRVLPSAAGGAAARGGGGGRDGAGFISGLLAGGGRGGGDQGLGTGLFKGIGPGILGLGVRSASILGLGAAGLGALPAIGAIGGAAAVGGAGIGFAALGAKTLIGTKNVKGQPATEGPAFAQAQVAGEALKAGLMAGARGMLTPLIAGLKQIPSLMKSIVPDLKQAFAGAGTIIQPLLLGITDIAHMALPLLGQAFRAVAPLIRPLLDGIGGLVKGFLPGLITLLRAAAPAIKVFADVLSTIGKDLGTMLSEFAPVIKPASAILKALLDVVSALFPIIGKLAAMFANALAPVFVTLAGVIKSLLPFLTIIGKLFASLAGAILTDLVAAFNAVAQLLIAVSPSLTLFANALSGIFTVMENSGVFAILGDALEALVKPLAKLITAILKGLTPLLPPVIKFISSLSGILITGLVAAITALLPPLTQLALVVLQAIAETLPVLLPLFTMLVGILTIAFVRVIQDLAVALSAIITAIPASVLRDIALGFLAIWAAIKIGGIVSAASNPIVLIGIAVALLIVGIVELVKHWGTVWGEIKRLTEDAWKFIQDILHNKLFNVILAIAAPLLFLALHWKATWSVAKQIAADFYQWFWSDFGAKIGNFLVHTIPSWLGTLQRGWGLFFGNVKQIGKDFWTWLWTDFGAKIKNFLVNTVPGWFTNAVTLIGNAWGFVRGKIAGPIKTVANATIVPLFKGIDAITNFVIGKNPLAGAVTTLQNLATGGKITRGTHETADDVVVRVSRNETVLSAMHSRMLAPLLAQIGVPGYASGGLVNPIGRGATPGRVDMGVDYGGSFPLYALGSGRIVSLFNSGWPGGAFVDLQLNPPYGSGYWFYAENVTPTVRMNQGVTAGQQIGWATGQGIEVGWATGNSGQTAAARDHQIPATGDPGAHPTAWGVNASELIHSLGGPAGIVSGKIVGGTAGFGGLIRTISQILSSIAGGPGGQLFKIALDLAHGDTGGASRAFMHLIGGAKSGGAGGDLGKTLMGMPGRLLKDAVGFLVRMVKGFVNTQQSAGGVPGGTGPTSASAKQAMAYAHSRMAKFGWNLGNMWDALVTLWMGESGWNRLARNPGSGAYGIPQALPGSKMGAAANPPTSSAGAQIDWGMNYIKSTPGYGDPAVTFAKWNARHPHWYGKGGPIKEPVIGFGQHTGEQYNFGERGMEWVSPAGPGGAGPGGQLANVLNIMLPEGSTLAQAFAELSFRLRVAQQQGWAGVIPGG